MVEETGLAAGDALAIVETSKAAVAVIKDQFDEIVPLTQEVHASATILARDHRFAFFDALIVAAAISAGREMLYSEDMRHGARLGGLTIVDPFR